MTDRRRNFFILLVVAGLLAGSIAVILTKETRLGLDLRGGVELIYEAKPTPQQPTLDPEALERTIEVMRERVDQLGVAEPEIQRTGESQISVQLPDVEDADEARRQVGTVAQLVFYDYEANVLGPGCEPAPGDPEVTGGAAAGQPGPASLSLYDAVLRAEKCPELEPTAEALNQTGHFYLVDEREKKVLNDQPAESKEELLEDFNRTRGQRVVEVKPGTIIIRAEQPESADEEGAPQVDQFYVLRDKPALKGTDIKNPEQQFDQGAGGSGQPVVSFEFNDRGRKAFQEITQQIAERGAANQVPGTPPQQAAHHFAIVLDQRFISVPFIDFTQNPTGIDAATGSQIEGGFTIQTAQRLANLLKTGALPVRLELISQSQVSATLGQQSLDQGVIAGLSGFAVVALFLLAFYRILGVIAVIALLLYAVYFYALMKLIPVTLTLPGIAGLILTIGVAADANIVIFERVKEEVRAGRSTLAGIATGYRKGITAIIDANVVTVMVAFILFVLATAGVKGFAFVLGIGTFVSLFTAVLATQAILGTLGRSKTLSRPSALGAGGERSERLRLNYTGASRWFFSMSGLILLAGALIIGGKGVTFGIDFESGTRIRAQLEQRVGEDRVREVLADQGLDDAEIQRVSDAELGEGAFQISVPQLEPDAVNQVVEALDDELGIEGEPNTQSIGPTFGEAVANNAIIAIIASLIVISAYIALRFEWKYAVPVLIAVTHDILITAGVYAATGYEVSTATVAAFLTILGYSLYDTIIVFDRIRENVPRMPRATFSQIVNRSLSEVIVRSLATSFSTLLPVTALYFFGGETLQDFAFALMVGIVSGTYSSVFIATPVLVEWKEREPVYRRRRERVAAEHGGVVPAYAAGAGAAVVDEPEARPSGRSIFTPDTPDSRQVGKDEFDEMVRELHAEPGRPATALEDPDSEPEHRPAADAGPEDVVMPDERRRDRPRKHKSRKHGRPR